MPPDSDRTEQDSRLKKGKDEQNHEEQEVGGHNSDMIDVSWGPQALACMKQRAWVRKTV